VPPEMIRQQIQAALGDGQVRAVKIGMIGGAKAAASIADALRDYDLPVIFDPVIRASSGGRLSDTDALQGIIALSELVTPNLDEAAWLCGEEVQEMERQAATIRERGDCAVLIKGGHGDGESSCDTLFLRDMQTSFCGPRLMQNRRGTGCTLATYIACFRAMGLTLPAACGRARELVQDYIARGHEKSRL